MNFCLLIDKNLTEEENLTSGGFSIVNKGTLVNLPVVIKKTNKTNSTDQEINLLQLVKSKYLPIFFGVKENSDNSNKDVYSTEPMISIILEKVNGDTLDHYLQSKPSKLLKSIHVCELASIVFQLHGFNMIHKDLKPKNVMIDEAFSLKLLDFGISVRTEDKQTTCSDAGTLCYMSPEYVPEFDKHGNLIPKINEKSDVWAFGLIISEIFSGERPWSKLINQSYDVINLLKRKVPFQIPNSITNQYERDYIANCTTYDCSKRFSSKDCLLYSLMILYSQIKDIMRQINNCNNNDIRLNSLYEVFKDKLNHPKYEDFDVKEVSSDVEAYFNKSINYSEKSNKTNNKSCKSNNFSNINSKKIKSTPFSEAYSDKFDKKGFKASVNCNSNKSGFKFANNCNINSKQKIYDNSCSKKDDSLVNNKNIFFKNNDKKKHNKNTNANNFSQYYDTTNNNKDNFKSNDLESIANEFIKKKLLEKENNCDLKTSEINDRENQESKLNKENNNNNKNKLYYICLKKIEDNLKILYYNLKINKLAKKEEEISLKLEESKVKVEVTENRLIKYYSINTSDIDLKNEEEESLYYSPKKELSLCDTKTMNTINAPTINPLSKIDTEIETSCSMIFSKNINVDNSNLNNFRYQAGSLSLHAQTNEHNSSIKKKFETNIFHSAKSSDTIANNSCRCSNCKVGNESMSIILNTPPCLLSESDKNNAFIVSEHFSSNNKNKRFLLD